MSSRSGCSFALREADQLCAEERIVASPTPNPNHASRCLCEPVPPPRYDDDADRLSLDVELEERIPADVAGGLHGAMDVILGSGIERPRGDRAVVAHADENHPTIGVGERDRGALELLLGSAAFELDVLALSWELGTELLRAERKRYGCPGCGMEQWICQTSRCAGHG